MSVCQWRGRYLTGSYHFVNMFVLWQFLEGFLLMYQCVGGVAVSRQFSVMFGSFLSMCQYVNGVAGI